MSIFPSTLPVHSFLICLDVQYSVKQRNLVRLWAFHGRGQTFDCGVHRSAAKFALLPMSRASLTSSTITILLAWRNSHAREHSRTSSSAFGFETTNMRVWNRLAAGQPSRSRTSRPKPNSRRKVVCYVCSLGDNVRERHGAGPSTDRTGHHHRLVAFDYFGTSLARHAIGSECNTAITGEYLVLDGQGRRTCYKPTACLRAVTLKRAGS